jgi:predicted metal-binding membrane protein
MTVAMMTAMMLPAVGPAAWQRACAGDRLQTVPRFIASYLAVWAFVSAGIYALSLPHSTLVTGTIAIAVGGYEFTPLKRHFRQGCARDVHSGITYGLYCAGSCFGLMLMQAAFGMISVVWMAPIAVVVLAQKLVRPNAFVDVPLGLAIVAVGILLIVAPMSVLGLVPPICGGPKL